MADTDNSSIGSKRKRTSRACDQCRASKRRCDGRQPQCGFCQTNDQTCTYESGTKKRGLPTGYVKSVELLMGLILTAVPNSEHVIDELLSAAGLCLDSGGKSITIGNLNLDPEALRETWCQSRIHSRLWNLSAIETNTTAQGSMRGLSQLQLSPFRPVSIEHQTPESTTSATSIHQNAQASPKQKFSIAVASLSNAIKEAQFAFPENARQLVDIYFSFTHCWFPIVERHEMFQVLYSAKQHGPSNSGSLAMFWAILAYASLQDPPRDLGEAANVILEPEGLDSHQMYSMARHLVPLKAQDLGHAKALLILSLYECHQDSLSDASQLIGQAVRICLNLRKGTLSGASSREGLALHKSLFGCFILDTLVSCCQGQPPHLRTADLEDLHILDETGPDEWDLPTIPPNLRLLNSTYHSEPLRAMSVFNNFLHIVRFLNDITFSSKGPSQGPTHDEHISTLNEWSSRLPPHCKLPVQFNQANGNNTPNLSLHLFNLHIALRVVLVILEIRSAFDCQTPTQDVPKRLTSISELLTAFGKQHGGRFRPATFILYRRMIDNLNKYGKVIRNNERQTGLLSVEVATKDEIAPLESQINGSLNLLDHWGHITQGSSTVAESSLLSPIGIPDEAHLPYIEHDLLDELSGPTDIEWDHHTMEFMQNLGFTNWASQSPNQSREPP